MLSTPEKSGLKRTSPSERISMRQSSPRTVTSQRLCPSSSWRETFRWLALLHAANIPEPNMCEGGAAGAGGAVVDADAGAGGAMLLLRCGAGVATGAGRGATAGVDDVAGTGAGAASLVSSSAIAGSGA